MGDSVAGRLEMFPVVLIDLFFYLLPFYRNWITAGATRFAGAVEVN